VQIRIGRALDGSVVSVDTASIQLLTVVADPGNGKTTLARYLARWWCADPARTAGAFAEHPHQYGDLPIQVQVLTDAGMVPSATSPHKLTIIDGADRLEEATLRRLSDAPGLTIFTSYGEAARAVESHAQLCLGLLRRDAEPGGLPHQARGLAHDAFQGRLDWPYAVVPVLPDTLGARDVPVHRWDPLSAAHGRAV
jgi:hypothetical protein